MSKYLLALLIVLPAMGETVFYNGNPSITGPNGGNFLDCNNCRGSGLFVYDDFTLNSTTTINTLFGHWFNGANNTAFLPNSSYWAIRQGVGQNNDGTLLFSGNSAMVNTFYGSESGRDYYRGTVSGLSLVLGPGTYWLTISPTAVDTGSGELFLVGSNGAGGVNSRINGESYVRGPYWSGMQNVAAYLQPFTGQSTYDWSYGVTGSAAVDTPEPASAALIGAGLIWLALRRRGATK